MGCKDMTIENSETSNRPQVKICGITRAEDAVGCAQLGANALGFVFFPKSPRNISSDDAKDIIRKLPSKITTVGVFVNESFSGIMEKVNHCGLSAVQLHGQEPPELVHRLTDENLLVIKALFVNKAPDLDAVTGYDASAYLLECGKGFLPGGNAMQWDWGRAEPFGRNYPLILAGGLSPDNVSQAISDGNPDAVDVSSGVEIRPGIKDLEKVKQFLTAVSRSSFNRELSPKKIRKIFIRSSR